MNSASWGAIPSASFVRCMCALKYIVIIIYIASSHHAFCEIDAAQSLSLVRGRRDLYPLRHMICALTDWGKTDFLLTPYQSYQNSLLLACIILNRYGHTMSGSCPV